MTDLSSIPDDQLDSMIAAQSVPASSSLSSMSDDDLDKAISAAQPKTPAYTPSFGSNRGVSTPRPDSAGAMDFLKSFGTGAEESPFIMPEAINAVQRGMGRLYGEAYTGLGGDLSPEQADALTNPRTQLPTGADIVKSAGLPVHEPEGAMGVAGNILGNVAGAGALTDVLPSAAEKATDALQGAKSWYNDIGNPTPANIPPKPLPAIPAADIKNASQNAYKYSENVGGVLAPDTFTNNILDMIDNAKAQPIAGKVLTSEQKALNSALGEYAPLRDSPLTLEDFENLDKSLTAKESSAMDGFKPTNNSRIIGQVQDQIRARLQNLAPEDVIGGKDGFDALTQHAIPLWSTQTKMADLETLLNKAQGTANPTQSTKTVLNNLINSPKFNNYPAITQEAIKNAAQRGNADDLMGVLGSRLNPITSNTIAGKAVNMATSSAFRSLRNAQQAAKVDKIMSSMTDPVRDSVKKFSTVPELPPDYVKPSAPVPKADPYINPNAGQITKPQADSEINLTGKPSAPVLGGTSSDYFAKGGAVQPTEAQKHAGNYQKQHIKIHGLDISIENPKGSIRSGKDKDGKEWKVKMAHPYGYIRGTVGADKDHVDCFIGPNPKSLRVYVIDQKNHKGTFDEHKIMLGFPTRESALKSYRDSYSDKKNRIMHVKKMLISDFKEWLKNGDTKKPIKDAA